LLHGYSGVTMKNPFRARPPFFNAAAIQATIQKALASAGLNTKSGPMHDVTETIRRALHAEHPAAAAPGLDGFTTHSFTNDAGSRVYKVYVPNAKPEAAPAIVVMLHGCTQSPDDFAMGTQMNAIADAHGFLVVYPEQALQANTSKCWNWFKREDQMRGAGEPSLIAGIVREVAQKHGADAQRIFVAGLSAGAAMALVLGETYPELFAGVGVHSGLPYASAHDVPTALAAMKGGRNGGPRGKAMQAVPIIVFHGDRDHTVQLSNSTHIVEHARDAYGAQGGGAELVSSESSGVSPGGRSYKRTTYANAEGRIRIESWIVHGAGHAWSGGNAGGTYTDGKGPDASVEMVRFFLTLQQME
jgi:poly(hydroxyalkanoate) depolymerase family esterase